jgi:starch-binding outer membrane protein SusE/F
MKNIRYLSVLLAVLVFGTACEKEEDRVVLDLTQTVAPVLTIQENLVLLEENARDSITFQWSAAQYALPDLQSITYALQYKHVDSPTYITITSTDTTIYKMAVRTLNTRIRNDGFPKDEPNNFHFRVVSFIQNMTNGTLTPSSDRAVSITPYEAAVQVSAVLYVPGDYQGWSPETAPVIYSPASNNQYSGYIHMPSGNNKFKFITEPTWASGIHYGTGGTQGTLSPTGGDLIVTGPGTWYFTVNTDELTWTSQLRNFALIGTFNNWNADEPLEWDAENKVFTITRDFEAGAKFKWRANAAWTVNLGLNRDNLTDGTLVQDGADLELTEAGNYTIILDLYSEVPTYEIIKN